MRDFMDATVQTMCNKAKATKEETMDAASVNRVYQLTPVESPLRRLAVDRWTHGVKPTQFGGDNGEFCNDSSEISHESNKKLLQRTRCERPNNAANQYYAYRQQRSTNKDNLIEID